MEKYNFINLSKEKWSNPRRARKQLLFEALLTQPAVQEVLYVDPPDHFGWTHIKPLRDLRGMRICERGYFLRGERFASIRAINRWTVYLAMRKALKTAAQWHTVFYNPWDLCLAKFLSPYGPILYDWTEDWAVYHESTALVFQQRAAIDMASGIIAATENLADRARELSKDTKHILFLPNATAWEPIESQECPQDMMHISSPRIGYIGHLGPWFDKDLVLALSRARPEWQWVMVGYADGTLNEFFQDSKNIHLLGRRPFTKLQSYMAQCEVLVAPYRENIEGDSSKLYDYLTLGSPIISTTMTTAKRLQPHVRMASGVESWLHALEQALGENDPAAREARHQVSLQHTWDLRAATLLEWLDGLGNA